MIATISHTKYKGNDVFQPPLHLHHSHHKNEYMDRRQGIIGKSMITMALNLNLSLSPKCKWVGSPSMMVVDTSSSSSSSSLGSSKNGNNIAASNLSLSFSTVSVRRKRRSASSNTVRSSLETAGPTVTVGKVTEVNKDTFWPIVKAAGDKTVVLDMYTQWYQNLYFIIIIYIFAFLRRIINNIIYDGFELRKKSYTSMFFF